MKVAIYGTYDVGKSKEPIEELFGYLLGNNFEVVVEHSFLKALKMKTNVKQNFEEFNDFEGLNNRFDAMITIGGDGTILKAVMFVRHLNIPILGINTGRLGFLATVQKTQIKEAIDALIYKNYTINERDLLKVTTNNADFNVYNFALNEVAINRKDSTSMIVINTYIDNEFLTSYWADGLIIATPTGSTGYSLSCGGPVMTPSAKSLVVTPIAPHNLNVRPVVIPIESKIKLQMSGRNKQFLLSLDSRIFTVEEHTEIYIEKADFKIKMIQLNNQSFINTLRQKLLWGSDTRN